MRRIRLLALLFAVALVAAACGDSADTTTTTAAPTANVSVVVTKEERPGPGDHWHAAYGVWICGEFQEPLSDLSDPYGIHTDGDGLIHIHPYSRSAYGANATLGLFADTVGIEFSEASFSLPSGELFESGDECDGEEGVVRVLEWEPDASPEEVVTHSEEFGSVRLTADGAAYTIALMALDTPAADLFPPYKNPY